MRLRRRGVLLAGVAGLAGCASEPTASPEVTGPPETTDGPAHSSTPAPRPSPTTEPSPSAEPSPEPSLPSQEEIVERYEDRESTQWGLEVDGVLTRSDAEPVAITLDACGGANGSGYDEELIAHLRRLGVPATLFLNARWIEANPETAAELAADPLFELANHGLRHLPLSIGGRSAYGISGTASVGEVYDEVVGGAERLTALAGEPPRWFRSGTAHVDEVAVEITRELGMATVNFDINADAGATFSAAQVRQAMAEARPGSICIGHFNRPGSGTASGMGQALTELLDQGYTFAQLRDVFPQLG